MKKWIESDLITKTIDDYNDNMEEIERNLTEPLILENLIENGDFSDGTVGWSLFRGYNSLEVAQGELIATKNTTNSIINSALNIEGKSGYKYYVQVKVKSDKAVSLNCYLRTSTTIVSTISSQITMTDEYIKHTGIITLNENVTNAGLHLRTISATNADATITMKEVSLINLTQTFGAGNEPSNEQMDEIINIIGWFDNEYTLSNKEMFIALLNMVRKNTMAIIALGGTQ